jgi:hypothetical protein
MSKGLTRTEAYRHLGLRTVEGIRYLERTGKLHPTKDEAGVNRFDVAELDRVKKEREEQGITPRLTTEELALTRADRAAEVEAEREHEAWCVKFEADREKRERLESEVRRGDEAARDAFLRDYVTERTAAEALGFGLLERRARLDELVGVGKLREVEPPLSARIVLTVYGEPLRVEQGPDRIRIDGGPFYPRAEVLALRDAKAKEASVAADARRGAGGGSPGDLTLAELLRLLLGS